MRGDPAVGRLLISLTDPAARGRWKSCVDTLRSAGHLVQATESLKQAVQELASSDFEVAVIAMSEGRAAERRIADLLSRAPDLTLMVIAGVPGGATARGMIVSGAYAIEDPSDYSALDRTVGRAVRYCRALRREARFEPGQTLSRLLGTGAEIRQIERLVTRAAGSATPILVIGEPGSGKHIVAQAMHVHPNATRRSGPFVKCLLGGIDLSRIGEDLYGTVWRPGPFERANGGTLFIEDLTLLPIPDQARLVELLNQGGRAVITRADGSGVVPADVRLVAGSPVGPEELESQRGLLPDLLDRVRVYPIRMPPLRRRVADIPGLAGALIDRYAAASGTTVVGLTPRAAVILQRYSWPGNIRELEEHIERAVRRARGPVIEPADLAELAHMTAGGSGETPTRTLEISLSLDESLPLAECARRAALVAEVAAIRRALKTTEGNVTKAAALLRVSRIHLQKRMKKYGLRKVK